VHGGTGWPEYFRDIRNLLLNSLTGDLIEMSANDHVWSSLESLADETRQLSPIILRDLFERDNWDERVHPFRYFA
jgi:hypothetical protein